MSVCVCEWQDMLIGASQLGVKRSVFVLRLQTPRRMSRCCRIDQVSKGMASRRRRSRRRRNSWKRSGTSSRPSPATARSGGMAACSLHDSFKAVAEAANQSLTVLLHLSPPLPPHTLPSGLLIHCTLTCVVVAETQQLRVIVLHFRQTWQRQRRARSPAS